MKYISYETDRLTVPKDQLSPPLPVHKNAEVCFSGDVDGLSNHHLQI